MNLPKVPLASHSGAAACSVLAHRSADKEMSTDLSLHVLTSQLYLGSSHLSFDRIAIANEEQSWKAL